MFGACWWHVESMLKRVLELLCTSPLLGLEQLGFFVGLPLVAACMQSGPGPTAHGCVGAGVL